MTNKALDRVVVMTAALFAAMAGAGVSAQTVGVNASVVNDVRMTTEANPAIHRAAVKERVSLGNDIVTGHSSVLQVLLLDRTSFTVGSNAKIKVDRFVYDPSRSASAVGLSVTKGAFRFMSGKSLRANPGQSSIKTPIATIGIRGTIVEGVVGRNALKIVAGEVGLPANFSADPETASLIMLRGPGANALGEMPGAIDVIVGDTTIPVTGPGYAVFIPGAGKPPIGPFLMSARGSTLLADLLRLGQDENGSLTPPLKRDPLTELYFLDDRQKG